MIDLLVVGGGPTGLFLAAEATRHGLTCRLIDSGPPPSDLSRAVAIQPRTLEIFRHVGVIDPFLAEGLPLRAGCPISRGKPIAHIEFSALDSPYPFLLSLQQDKTERILEAHAAALGVKKERSIAFTHFEPRSEGVLVRAGEESIHARWCVGCDGAHSNVRKALHLSFPGTDLGQLFSVADMRIDWDYPPDELVALLDARGALAAIPLPEPHRYRLIFPTEPSLEQVQKLLQPYGRVSEPRWMAPFHIHSRKVATYRCGAVFLAGDAAHIHSPVGGQGMNTGLQDAFNLAWKLAYVKRGLGGEALLDTYSLERERVGARVVRATKMASHLVTLKQSWLIALRNQLLRLVLNRAYVQKKLLRALSQTGIQYPQSSIVAKGAGHQAPFAVPENTTCWHLAVCSEVEARTMQHLSCAHLKIIVRPTRALIRPDLYVSGKENQVHELFPLR